ncbi:MAG: hypothetical protein ACE5D7_07645, partial [Fidelibacterota bacterium]
IQALQKFSKIDIIIITDPEKNEINIPFENVIHVKTPDNFDPHQSAIFLKTSIHRHIDTTNRYCYLDTDMIARSDRVNHVFDTYTSPISFGRDYVDIQHFSPFAMHCGCKEKFAEFEKKLTRLLQKHDPNYHRLRDPENRKKITRIEQLSKNFQTDKRWALKRMWKRWFDRAHIHLTDFTHYVTAKSGYTWDNESLTWYDEVGEIIYSPDDSHKEKIESEGGFKFDSDRQTWKTLSGLDVQDTQCSHLQNAIFHKSGIRIPDRWQHWNGGLFLFDSQSEVFLEDWHTLTMDILTDPTWVNRDQGTLAATVWKHRLQDHQIIPSEYNFLFTPRFRNARYLGKNKFSSTGNTIVRPAFLHLIDGITDLTKIFWGINDEEKSS